MSNNENSPPPTPTSARRKSFSPGQKFSEIFGRSQSNNSGTPAYPGPISTSVANAQAQQRRRTSIASLTMAGSPTQTSPFANIKNRQGSFASSSSPSTSVNENAIEEGDAEPNPSPTSPSAFARRVSFGARALRDVQSGNGEGFNWSEQIKNRAERSASITGQPAAPSTGSMSHQKSASIAAAEQPIKEMPKTPRKPDHFQERILKGDFYMD